MFIFGSISAVLAGFPSGAFDDASFASLIFHEIVLGAIALAFLHYRGYPIAALIPHPTATGSLIGISLYAVSSVAAWVPVWLLGARDHSAEPIEQMAAGATIA